MYYVLCQEQLFIITSAPAFFGHFFPNKKSHQIRVCFKHKVIHMLLCAHLLTNLDDKPEIQKRIFPFLRRCTGSGHSQESPIHSSDVVRSSAPAASFSAGIRYAADGSFGLQRRWQGWLAQAWWSANPARKETTQQKEVRGFTIKI